MEKIIYKAENLPFKESQIICLEYQSNYLYGEVIELILSRQMCWFRPICSKLIEVDSDRNLENTRWINLSSASDLLLPIWLFRPALDTEIISWLSNLDRPHQSFEGEISPRQYLNRLVREVWNAHQDKF